MGFATRVVRMALQDVISLSVFWVSYFLTLASLSAYELDSGTAPLSRYDCFRCFVPMYRVRQIKVIPCGFLLISQQRIGIFKRKFTRLFVIHIYV